MPTLLDIACIWVVTTAVLLLIVAVDFVAAEMEIIAPKHRRSKDAQPNRRPVMDHASDGRRSLPVRVAPRDLVEGRRMLVVETWVRGHHYIYRSRPADVGRLLSRLTHDALDPEHPLTPWQAGVLQEHAYRLAEEIT